MKRKCARAMIAAACAAALLPSPVLANRMGPGKAEKINALGISAGYARTRDRNDAGLYASYRYGSMWIISLFFSADAGYRFHPGSVNARVGGEAMFLVVGLEAGLLLSYRTKAERGKWHERERPPGPCAPGAYIGLAGLIPSNPVPVFLSAGGNFYFVNHDHEFYLLVSGLVNFARF